jgi:hypothetical protein
VLPLTGVGKIEEMAKIRAFVERDMGRHGRRHRVGDVIPA